MLCWCLLYLNGGLLLIMGTFGLDFPPIRTSHSCRIPRSFTCLMYRCFLQNAPVPSLADTSNLLVKSPLNT
ncbi:hypothetical protein JOQ06_021630 [Pogonophryne albipinna]|uniref:Secreted protein n=1 Tax=Pogonophryne albipinna TaxID=1090488 RepID=A0AAD6F5P7_9TELE|nr:hypothetical protein JOQ06_021630 [Pogonophryne albipinna]